jgi:hypothetical protein
VSPHNFLTCFFFSRSEAETETGFGLNEGGGRRAREAAVGTTMEKRERARCCASGCFDAATTVDLLPAAIEAHEDEDEDEDDEAGFFCF